MEAYKEFLAEFQKIESSKKDTQISFVMSYLQDLGNGKKFEEFQAILDNAEPSLFGDGAVTIALVAWWYGEKLNRHAYVERAIDYYTEKKGNREEAERIFKNIRVGGWKPSFGFERDLFGIKE